MATTQKKEITPCPSREIRPLTEAPINLNAALRGIDLAEYRMQCAGPIRGDSKTGVTSPDRLGGSEVDQSCG